MNIHEWISKSPFRSYRARAVSERDSRVGWKARECETQPANENGRTLLGVVKAQIPQKSGNAVKGLSKKPTPRRQRRVV